MVINNSRIGDFFSGMPRCTRCLLPVTFPGIGFDDEGVCSYCRSYQPMHPLGEEKLVELLSRFTGRGVEYDIAVPASGGRDSAFVLHQIVKKYSMKAIAITVDSGFTFEEGWRNLAAMTRKLGVPHVVLRDEKTIAGAKRNAKMKFKGWVRSPSINSIIPVLNAGDKTMNFQMYSYAASQGIPIVMGGNNVGNASVEQDHWKTGFMGIFPDDRGNYSSLDKTRLMLKYGIEFVRHSYNFRIPILQEYIGGITTYLFDTARRPKEVTSAGFYDYIYWHEKTILKTITEELDWEGASDTPTTWRIDDSAYPMINYLMLQLVGFTEHDEMLSKLIRENQITRKEAIVRLAEEQKPRMCKLEKDLDEYEISLQELNNSLSEYRKKLLPRILKKHYGKVEIG